MKPLKEQEKNLFQVPNNTSSIKCKHEEQEKIYHLMFYHGTINVSVQLQ